MSERASVRFLASAVLAFLVGLGAEAVVTAPVQAQSDVHGPARFVGHWEGAISAAGQTLPILFHLTQSGTGFSATLDSPAQGAVGVPMDEPQFRGDTLVLGLRVAGATYTGVIDASGDVMEGTWAQGPGSTPLVMHRVSEAEAGESVVEGLESAAVEAPAIPSPEDRPQAPRPPFPYSEAEVRFPSAEEGVELVGNLTLPDGDGMVPGVILVSGSGPQDRDETLMGHKPFHVLADYLSRRGIAVLRYDDRGVGESGGDFASATSVDLSRDAEGAVAFLAAQPRVNADAVGIVGHSEGGLIGPMVAARSQAPGFLVLLAGPGTTGEQVLLDQARLIGEASGEDEDLLERGLAMNARLFAIARQDISQEEARAQVAAEISAYVETLDPEQRAAEGVPEGQEEAFAQATAAQLTSPWFRYFVAHDPAESLAQTRVPVLALNGELDLQVPAETNLAAIRSALEAAGNDDFTTVALPGLNHLFQTAETGAPEEYATIDETMSEEAMAIVAEWVLARFGR